ncbi:hypothetical protein U1Q18_040617 [Sarracenia purpurea var. burkii]
METSGFQLADVSGEQTFSWGAVCNGCGSRRLHPQDSGFLIFVRMSSTWRALFVRMCLDMCDYCLIFPWQQPKETWLGSL